MKNPIKRLAALAAAGALLATSLVVGVALPASAHTPTVSATCNSLTVNAVSYETKPGTAGTPAVYGPRPVITAAVPASSFWQEFSPNEKGPFVGTPLYPTDPNGTWSAPKTDGGPSQDETGVFQQGNGNGSWFYRENTPAVAEVLGDAPLVTAEVLAVPADPTPNTVTVEVDGVVVVDTKFGTSYSLVHPLDGTQDHTYKVRIRAWNDPQGYNGWSKNFTGTTTKCVVPPPVEYAPSCTTNTGAKTLVGDGVLTVEGNWATDTIAVPFTGKLKDIGSSNTLGINASPLQYVGLHITTSAGTIVFEEEASYGGKLWSTTPFAGVDAGLGYAALGSVEDFVRLNGNLDVSSVTLLYTHPNASSTTVESFSIGCTAYTFQPAPTVVDLPTQYSVEPTAPTCETAGALAFTPGTFGNVTLGISPAYTGPGTYVVTATAINNTVFEGGGTVRTRTITVSPATGVTQSENPEGLCYVAPPVEEPPVVVPEPETPVVVDEPACEEFPTQESAQAWIEVFPGLDADGDGVACETLPGTAPVASSLAVTGAPDLRPLALGAVFLLAAGGLLFGFRRKLFPSKGE